MVLVMVLVLVDSGGAWATWHDSMGEVAGRGELGGARDVAAVAGNAVLAREINAKLFPLHQKLFVEANPIPVKWAMQRMGLCGPTLRLPMTELSASQQPVVEAALKSSELI